MPVVFPLAIMRAACRLAARGYADTRYFHLPPLVVNQPAARNVHCGNLPLVRAVNVSGVRRFETGASCYINTAGEFVFPA